MTGRCDGSHKHYELVEVHRGVSIGVQVLEQFVHGLLVPSALEETGARVSDAGAAGRPSRAGGRGGCGEPRGGAEEGKWSPCSCAADTRPLERSLGLWEAGTCPGAFEGIDFGPTTSSTLRAPGNAL